jgi:organic hydroperoxide reductase OsmC/OhrA
MEMQSTNPPTQVKHKTFTYHTNLSWLENRAGMLRSDDKQQFRVASPPEFKGEAGVWSPEDLYVASVDVCTMATFLAFAQRYQVPLVSYESKAEGVLEFIEGRYQFTKVFVRPSIVVQTAEGVKGAERAIHDAHKGCLIAHSIKAEVFVEPDIKIQSANI